MLPLVRRKPNAGEIAWDPAREKLDTDALKGVDAVVHLAAETISGPWTKDKKRRILRSRANGTALLSEGLASLEHGPKTLVSASAVGYYGDAGEAVLTEQSPPGDDFLARVCIAWEQATAPASRAGVRVVNLRFGVVIDPSGGMLRLILPAFRFGLGASVGSGRQWVSWISLADATRATMHALEDEGLSGPVNAVAPEPLRNADFTRLVAQSVGRRPLPIRVPALPLRLLSGGMAEALLLVSQRALPVSLAGRGFDFEHPSLNRALTVGLDGTV